jgi:hypothetical protein
MKHIKLFFLLMMITFLSSYSPFDEPKYKLIVFQGSDWCSNCIQFEKNVLSDENFTTELDKLNIKIEKIDFPQKKLLSKEVIKYNATIAEKYNFDGTFPTIYISKMDSNSYQKILFSNTENSQDLIKKIKDKIILLQ